MKYPSPYLKALFSALLLFFVAATASGQNRASSYDFMARAEAREVKRWTLQEWMAQKEKSKLMDLWLSFNSPSPYEFMLGFSHKGYASETTINAVDSSKNYVATQGEFHAYAHILGLSGEYENNTSEKFNDLTGMINLRLLGDSIQNSHLTVHYGLRTREREYNSTENIRSAHPFAQVSLQIYLSPYFGLDSKYRSSTSPNSSGNLSDNFHNLTEAGLFIDFKGFRIYGNWYKEYEQYLYAPTNQYYYENRTGVKSGIKIFF